MGPCQPGLSGGKAKEVEMLCYVEQLADHGRRGVSGGAGGGSGYPSSILDDIVSDLHMVYIWFAYSIVVSSYPRLSLQDTPITELIQGRFFYLWGPGRVRKNNFGPVSIYIFRPSTVKQMLDP